MKIEFNEEELIRISNSLYKTHNEIYNIMMNFSIPFLQEEIEAIRNIQTKIQEAIEFERKARKETK